uniref:Uncharacterized protein n=1 Tax=Acrobeloides nanus TaxID=290746 RepID=A0A914EAZ2_9BILA
MALFQPNDQVQQHFKFEGWLRVYEGLVSQLPHPAGSKSKPSKKFLNELKWHDGYCVARMDERSLICYANEQVAHLFDRHLSSVRLDLGRPEILDTSTDSNSNYSVVSSSMSMCSFGYATVDRAFTTNSKYYGKGMMAETETIRRRKHKKKLWERRFAYSTLRTIKAHCKSKTTSKSLTTMIHFIHASKKIQL